MELPKKSLTPVSITLSAEDRRLILAYGYPWPKIERDLRALAADRRDRRVTIDRFELERLIGDLSYSTNHAAEDALIEPLDDLCNRLECLERS